VIRAKSFPFKAPLGFSSRADVTLGQGQIGRSAEFQWLNSSLESALLCQRKLVQITKAICFREGQLVLL